MKIDEKTFKAMPAELKALFRKCPNPGSEEVVGLFPQQKSPAPYARSTDDPTEYRGLTGTIRKAGDIVPGYGDTGSAARFFYCAKASRADREEGNRHPTVKPTALMRYLCRLVTPPGGIVLDPFMGSGSTGKAAVVEGFRFVGIDLNSEYVEIARCRIAAAAPLFAMPQMVEQVRQAAAEGW